jgi:ABC-type methionine transport system ATPase subunit
LGTTAMRGLSRNSLDPDILFLDEPTAGLDPIGAAQFDQLILTLRDALGLSVFLVTHDLDTLYTITRKTTNRIFAIPVAVPAIPPKPRTAATMAMIRNVIAQLNMVILLMLL